MSFQNYCMIHFELMHRLVQHLQNMSNVMKFRTNGGYPCSGRVLVYKNNKKNCIELLPKQNEGKLDFSLFILRHVPRHN